MPTKLYREVQRRTIHDEYSVYSLSKLLKKLEDESIVRNDKRKKKNDELIDITNLSSEKEKISYLFNELPGMAKKCEEFEYERGYRYIYLYKYTNINLDKINSLVEENKVQLFTNNDVCNDRLVSTIGYPTYREIDNVIYLKFSMKLKSKLTDEDSIKHVILVVINRNNNLIEIRQDAVPIEYNPKDKFYNINTRAVRSWLESFLDATIERIDLQAITKYMKSNKTDEVKITALSLKRNGMKAELDSANNTDLMLPILDELRNLIDREPIFMIDKNTQGIKILLENFIEEIEETSDLPAAKILWLNNDYKVDAYHGEVIEDIPFLKWKGELKDKESIDYVTNYIIQCEKELREELED